MTSPPEGVFRHKRLRELVELSGRTTRPTRIHMADYSLRHRRDGNAATTILYHPRICLRQYSSSVMTAGRRELLEDGLRCRFRRGSRTFRGTTGRMEQREDYAGVPRGERTTRLRERADDRDSEPDYLLRPTRHGPGGTLLDYRAVLFIVGQLVAARDHKTFESALLNDIF